jgi:hypothetical protein
MMSWNPTSGPRHVTLSFVRVARNTAGVSGSPGPGSRRRVPGGVVGGPKCTIHSVRQQYVFIISLLSNYNRKGRKCFSNGEP